MTCARNLEDKGQHVEKDKYDESYVFFIELAYITLGDFSHDQENFQRYHLVFQKIPEVKKCISVNDKCKLICCFQLPSSQPIVAVRLVSRPRQPDHISRGMMSQVSRQE